MRKYDRGKKKEAKRQVERIIEFGQILENIGQNNEI